MLEYDILSDDGLFAGYVDSGIWELEQWLASRARAMTHFWYVMQDDFED